MDITKVTEGMRVRLTGPEGHPLHGLTGHADRVFTPEYLWEHEPLTPLSEPFAWLSGQVLVSLDKRPRSGPRNMIWTPYVTVRPGDIEPA
jgi:hypothetical protein